VVAVVEEGWAQWVGCRLVVVLAEAQALDLALGHPWYPVNLRIIRVLLLLGWEGSPRRLCSLRSLSLSLRKIYWGCSRFTLELYSVFVDISVQVDVLANVKDAMLGTVAA
jgi:hypothetical protein